MSERWRAWIEGTVSSLWDKIEGADDEFSALVKKLRSSDIKFRRSAVRGVPGRKKPPPGGY